MYPQVNTSKQGSAAVSSEQALVFARQLNEQAWVLRSEDPKDMLAVAEEALHYAEIAGEKETYGYSLRNLGLAHFLNLNHSAALVHLEKSLQIFIELENKKECAMIERSIGSVYKELSNTDQALRYLLHSLELSREIYDTLGIASNLSIVAGIHRSLENDTIALEYYQEALALTRRLEDKQKISWILGSIGVIYSSLGQHAKALECQLEALAIKQEMGNLPGIGLTLSSIGFAYGQIGEYRLALDYFLRSLEVRKQINDKRGIAIVLNNIGEIYFNLGEPEDAIQYLLQAVKIAEEIQAEDILLQTHEACAKTYKDMQDFSNAYHHLEQYSNIKNKLFKMERQSKIAAMQVEYEVAKQKVQQEELKRRLAETEHKAIRSQINPHFLSNALNSIQNFLSNNDKESAHRYLSRFGRLIRMTLEHVRAPLIPLATEIEIAKLYLEMERLRFGSRVEYSFSIDEDIDVRTTFVPPMLLQPYLENSLRHGILHLGDRQGLVRVEITIENDETMKIIVEDNGIGRSESRKLKANARALENHTSLGLSLNEERLELLRESTGKEMRIQVIDLYSPSGEACGTRIEVLLPLSLSPHEISNQ